jgi:hypothetical protein
MDAMTMRTPTESDRSEVLFGVAAIRPRGGTARLPSARGDVSVPLQDHRRDGYALVRSGLPPEWHRHVQDGIDLLSCPGNNLLAEIPDLADLFRDPPVREILDLILGPRWMLEPHRYAHTVQPGWWGTELHHDEFFGRPCHIRPPGMETVVLFYYPHAVGPDDGPTVVVPGSHHRIREWPDRGEWPSTPYDCTPLLVQAGTIAIVDFSLVHGSLQNRGPRRRQMIKFLVSGMESGPFDDDPGRLRSRPPRPERPRPGRARDGARGHARRLPALGPLEDRLIALLGDPDRYVQAYAAEALRRTRGSTTAVGEVIAGMAVAAALGPVHHPRITFLTGKDASDHDASGLQRSRPVRPTRRISSRSGTPPTA